MKQLKPNCFEKTEVRWEKYFKIMVKLVHNSIRSTKLSIAYSPCYSIVLMCYNSFIKQISIIKIMKGGKQNDLRPRNGI